MRGSPLWQVLYVVAAFAFAGWPVYRLTRPASAAAVMVVPETMARPPATHSTEPLELEAVFAPPPADFVIKCLGQTLATGQGPQARFSSSVKIGGMPPEGMDLVVTAHWAAQTTPDAPATNPSAMRVTARFADGRQIEKTFWSGVDGTVTDVFTIQK